MTRGEVWDVVCYVLIAAESLATLVLFYVVGKTFGW